jgi:restriction endonuclease S subunit
MKRKLSELATINSGYSFRSSVKHEPEGEYWVLRPGDIGENADPSEEDMTRTSISRDLRDRYFVDDEVVLFVTYGESNRAYCFGELPPNTIAGSAFTLIRPRKEEEGGAVEAPYLAWYMNQEPARAFYEAFRRGSTTSRISRKSLQALEIPVPPLHVQRRIGEIDELTRKEARLTQQWIEKRRLLIDNSLLQVAKEQA